jgi:hypothetical protein
MGGQRLTFEVAMIVAGAADQNFNAGHDEPALSYPDRRGRINRAMMSSGTYEMASAGSTGCVLNAFSDAGALQLEDVLQSGRLVAGFPGLVDRFELLEFGHLLSAGWATTPQLTSDANARSTPTMAESWHTANIARLGGKRIIEALVSITRWYR